MAGSTPPPGWMPEGMSTQTLHDLAVQMGMSDESTRQALWQQQQQAPATPQVWLGDRGAGSSGFGGHGQVASQHPVKPGPREFLDPDAAAASFYSWTPEELQANITRMQNAGFDVATASDAYSLWQQLVSGAAQTYYAQSQGVPGARIMTPWQVLDFISQGGAGGSGGSGGPTTTTATDQYSPSQMRAMGESTYQAEVGRNPTAGEQGDLQSSTTRTQTVDSKGNTTTSYGADLTQLATEQARSASDYAEYQASTKYFDALMSVIGRVV